MYGCDARKVTGRQTHPRRITLRPSRNSSVPVLRQDRKKEAPYVESGSHTVLRLPGHRSESVGTQQASVRLLFSTSHFTIGVPWARSAATVHGKNEYSSLFAVCRPITTGLFVPLSDWLIVVATCIIVLRYYTLFIRTEINSSCIARTRFTRSERSGHKRKTVRK